MSANTFTFFSKFGDALSMLGDEDRRDLLDAIYLYGSWGEEPELTGPVAAVFAAIREDIDNSKKSRKQGVKGGRPKSGPRGSADAETVGPDECETGGLDTCETGGFADTETGGFDKSETGGFAEHETHTKPYQAIPVQTRPKSERGARERFVRPGRDEVEAYAHDIGLPPGESDKFLDHFDANGWKVGGKTPMKSWKAAMRNWQRRLPEFSGKEATERDRYSEL